MIPSPGPTSARARRSSCSRCCAPACSRWARSDAAFEEDFAAYVGTRHAAAVSSGTAGLHLAVRLAGVGAGDEVITSPFSFVASANCALYEGATPVFADIDPVTFNIDPAAIEAAITPRTRAIVPVHVFGLPCDIEAINEIARPSTT